MIKPVEDRPLPNELEFTGFSGNLGLTYGSLTAVELGRGSAYRVAMPDATSGVSVDPTRVSTLSGVTATMIHVHGDMNLIHSSPSQSLHVENMLSALPERGPVMVSLAATLKVAGIMILVLVVAGVAANASSATYVAHPLFLAVMTVSGVFLFLMSFGRPS